MPEATTPKVFSRLKSRAALGGIGSLIFTIALFFAQGGFASMNPWYIVGLVVGSGLIVYGLVKGTPKERPDLEEMLTREDLTAILETLKGAGRLEDVSQGDAYWIVAKSIEMASSHGYNDILGLLADRADNVPLNQLMTNPCSTCGSPRNQRGRHGE